MALTYLKVKSAKCLCFGSCCFGLDLGLKNLVLFASLCFYRLEMSFLTPIQQCQSTEVSDCQTRFNNNLTCSIKKQRSDFVSVDQDRI